LGRDYLESKGYRQYEVSNFSKPGFECVHNKTYWHLQDYIGVGAGASGTVYACGMRWTNLCDINRYIDFWSANSAETAKSAENDIPRTLEVLDYNTQEFEFLMMGLRLLDGISASDYQLRFKKDLKERLNKKGLFDEWQKKGLAKIKHTADGDYYSLTSDGILVLNCFLECLLD